MFDTLPNASWRTKNDVFPLYDSVQLLKCVQNNWLNEKKQEQQFLMNNKRFVAKWNDLVELHKVEQQNLVKISKLVERSIGFFPIERQKFQLAFKCFVMKQYIL